MAADYFFLQTGSRIKGADADLGKAVAEEARARQPYASAAAAFQLYALTHKQVRATMTEKNAAIYKWLAKQMVKMIPAKDHPMPAERFVRVLDTITNGLLFTYFQTPELITEEVFISAFEALA